MYNVGRSNSALRMASHGYAPSMPIMSTLRHPSAPYQSAGPRTGTRLSLNSQQASAIQYQVQQQQQQHHQQQQQQQS